MIDSAAYRANETNAKRALASWRLSNINDPYVFQNQGFPVRADSFLDLAQILDTMQEGRFDYYMKELGGFSDEDTEFFVKVCLDYIDFYYSFFQRNRVVIPLSTLISHFVIYKKLQGYKPGFRSILEIGPGCGYLSFFLRGHESLTDYTQIESTESFYLLQSHINAHVFGSRFAERALPRLALDDHNVYVPKLDWHNPFHYEEQKIIKVEVQPVCNHYPWWRIGEVANRRYDIVTSNANLNEFSREALFQYLSLIRDVLADNGAIIAQCLGGGPPTYESIFANMKSAGFVPVALIQGDNDPSRIFVVSNAVFIGEKHPLYSKYADAAPQFPMIDRHLDFLNKMYYLNEDQPERKHIHTISDVLEAILDQIEPSQTRPSHASQQQLHEGEVSAAKPKIDTDESSFNRRPLDKIAQRIAPSAHIRDINRLHRIAKAQNLEGTAIEAWLRSSDPEIANRRETSRMEIDRMRLAAEVENLKRERQTLLASRSWRITAPLRYVGMWVRRRLPFVVRLIRWVRS